MLSWSEGPGGGGSSHLLSSSEGPGGGGRWAGGELGSGTRPHASHSSGAGASEELGLRGPTRTRTRQAVAGRRQRQLGGRRARSAHDGGPQLQARQGPHLQDLSMNPGGAISRPVAADAWLFPDTEMHLLRLGSRRNAVRMKPGPGEWGGQAVNLGKEGWG